MPFLADSHQQVKPHIVRHWSRSPGKWLDTHTGIDKALGPGVPPYFTGTVSQWYEILGEIVVETCKELGGSLSSVEIALHEDFAQILSFDRRALFFDQSPDRSAGVLCIDEGYAKGTILVCGGKYETIYPNNDEIAIRSGDKFASVLVHDMNFFK